MSTQPQPNPNNRKVQTSSSKPAQKKVATAPETAVAAAPAPRGPTQEQIARRAYELWLQHGQQHGREAEDWAQAERDLQLGRY